MSQELQHHYSQQVTVKELTDSSAVLAFADGQTVTWPLNLLPDEIKKEQTLKVIVHNKETDELERKALAREVLNEVMSTKN
jgi:hypothetical protein